MLNFEPEVVLYHASCSDGFCAAWLFHEAFPGVECIPVQHGSDPPEGLDGKNVVIVDFSYKRPVLEELRAVVKNLLVLDHHKSAQEDLGDLDYCVFDMQRSGGRLAKDVLFDASAFSMPVDNWVVEYTEDRDLWRHKLPNTHAVSAYIRSMPFEFDVWTKMFRDGNRFDLWSGIVQEGEAILRAQQRMVESHLSHPAWYDFTIYRGAGKEDTARVACVNCTCSVLISDVAHGLANLDGAAFGMTWFQAEDGTRVYSIRNGQKPLHDLSIVARNWGGGGHPNAAGFSVEPGDLSPLLLITEPEDGEGS